MVLLTAREHAIAHMLLCKIYPDNIKLLTAVIAMLFTLPKRSSNISKDDLRFSSRTYSNFREEFSKQRVGKPGHKQTKETRDLISKINTGRKFTEEQKKIPFYKNEK